MTQPELGHDAIEAIADELYTTLGIRGEGAMEQEYETFVALRSLYFVEHLPGVDEDGLTSWAAAEALTDCQNPEAPIARMPWVIASKVVAPQLATAYETGILIGVALAQRLAERAPEAPA